MEEIVKACIEDSRLLEIVKNINRMTIEEREVFKQKLSIYFMNRSDEVDVNAFRFFKYITEGNNSELVLKGVKEYERSKR